MNYADIQTSVNRELKNNFPNVNRPSEDIRKGFEKPAFFVQVLSVNEDDVIDYVNQIIIVNIHYFSELKTNEDNIDIADSLRKVFKNKLKVNDRVLTISNKKQGIDDNVLQFKFTLDFTEECEYLSIDTPDGSIVIPEYELDEELGYTEDTIRYMKDLEIEEGE